MSQWLLMDEHVPRAITTGLRARGINVMMAQEVEAANIPDEELLRRATEMGRVLFTNDKGFSAHIIGFYERHESFSGVIFAPFSLGIGATMKDLYLMAELMDPPELQNEYKRLPL